MTAIISLLIVLTISVLITRVATVALTHTGLSREASRFQARSAFTGVGFTTSESESIVSHPVRRRIVLILMLLGNVGVVTAMSSFIVALIGVGEGDTAIKVVLLAAGLGALWAAASSSMVDRHLSKVISWSLKRYTRLEVKDYASLLNLSGEYRVTELKVKPESWIADKDLGETKLRDEGVLVLAVRKEQGKYLGAPRGETRIEAGDLLVLYGRKSRLDNLDQRVTGPEGNKEHEEATREQKKVSREEAGDQ
jgi:hypothetical protein